MPKLLPVPQMTENSPEYLFTCPGCGYDHWFKTTGDSPRWTFNGDPERPTVSPSILVFKDGPGKRCHFFIENGQLRYLDDCEHPLAGQTVDMVEID